MLAFILRRVVLMVPILIGVSVLVFTLIHMVPGDPVRVMIGTEQRASPEQVAAIRRSYGLDQSKPVQYLKWMSHVVRGDLGKSIRTRRTINEELRLRLPVSIQLTFFASFLGTIPAVTVGVLAAVRRNSWLDYGATIGTLLGVSVPNFLLATLLVLTFSYWLKWLPPIGYAPFFDDPLQNLKSMLMPAVSLSMPFAAIMMRNTRSAVLEAMGSDHVRVARAKGLNARVVLTRHVLKNASIPIITVAGIQIATLLGGTVIIETIFGLPGIGRYIFESIANRDYPVVQGVTLVVATIFVLVSLFVDILYAVLDPRIRTTT